jgi:sulfatase maturation enzyme AslB (radical SAM superfamily)
MEKIKKYIHVAQPGTICNLNCSYCYVNYFTDNRNCPAKFAYPLEVYAKPISKQRIGGWRLSITLQGGGGDPSC